MKRNFLKAAAAGLALAAAGVAPLARAQDKGLIAISMPTKSSARWIASPTSPSSSEIPVTASLILVCASAAEYVALMVSFFVRKASTRACSC